MLVGNLLKQLNNLPAFPRKALFALGDYLNTLEGMIGAGGVDLTTNQTADGIKTWIAALRNKTHLLFTGSWNAVTTGAVKTTNATQTHTVAVTLVDSSAQRVVVWGVARNSLGNERAVWEVIGAAYRQGGGAVIEGTVATPIKSAGAAAWDVALTASGNDVRVSVTGQAATDIFWSWTVSTQAILTDA